VCGVLLTGRQRSACSAPCRAAWSGLRRRQREARRLEEAMATLDGIRRLAEIAVARLAGENPG
jgi:hypothetical protein